MSEKVEGMPSESEKLVTAFALLAIGMMAMVMIALMLLSLKIAGDAPRKDHIRSLREATCAKHGMSLLEDKYHPAVCAFRVDEEGKRIPD